MTERPRRTSELWQGVRRGAGWAVGVGGVITAASLLRDGRRETIKTLMRAGMRGRELAAELSEQVQDLYAEAQVEHAAGATAGHDTE